MGINETDKRAAMFMGQCPLPWVKHETANAANPCIAQLINREGFEGYGRYWRLIELLSSNSNHAIPKQGERNYRALTIGLGFDTYEEFEEFISTLQDLELVVSDGRERRCIPIVDEAAYTVGMARYNGRKGGKAAARNRQG